MPININIIAYAVLGLMLAGSGLYIFNSIKDMGAKDVLMQVQTQQIDTLIKANADKDKAIKAIEANIQLADEITEARDRALEELRVKLENLNPTDLGDDINDLAPASIRELIRRLRD